MEKTYGITDIGTFLTDHEGEAFLIWFPGRNGKFKKKPVKAYITQAAEIPEDVLLEIVPAKGNGETCLYYRLSEIRLTRKTK